MEFGFVFDKGKELFKYFDIEQVGLYVKKSVQKVCKFALNNPIFALPSEKGNTTRPIRLVVRTQDFHS